MAFTILLFYKYVDISKERAAADQPSQLDRVREWIQDAAERLGLSGRVLLATEGINGNLASEGPEGVDAFCKELLEIEPFKGQDIDFKLDTSEKKPFPDMVVKIKAEICSTGHAIPKDLIDKGKGGTHLSPKEFHETLKAYWATEEDAEAPAAKKELVVLDVRNDCEYKTGRFMTPDGAHQALNPSTHTYAQWVPEYASKNVGSWKDKKVLMYCTGGIRCEKASAYLRDKGCEDVSQLSGGIHRYLEEFGADGFFKGSNFVFDSRALQKPKDAVVVGACFNCKAPTEAITKDRVCAVCRCTILACDACRAKLLGVYYCDRHLFLRGAYEPFLDKFSDEELDEIAVKLQACWDQSPVNSNARRTIKKQITRTAAFKEAREVAAAAGAVATTAIAASTAADGKAAAAVAKKLEKRRAKQRTKWNTNPRCRSCGLIGPSDLLEFMGRKFSDAALVCNGRCTGFASDAYENPYRSLEYMNLPDFEERIRELARAKKKEKRAREAEDGPAGATKRHRAETLAEYDDAEYEKREDAATGLAMRHVKPYFYEYHTHVKARWLGRELLEVYAGEFSTHPVAYFKKAIELGLIRVNGKEVAPSYKLADADRIDNLMHRHEPDVLYCSADDMVLREDDDFVFVNKPASVSVHPCGSLRRNSLTFILAVEKKLVDLAPAHRLDRLTSGLVIMCKNSEIAAQVSDAMMRRLAPDAKAQPDASASAGKIQKAYLARVHNKFPADDESFLACRAKLRAGHETAGLEPAADRTEYLSAVGLKPPGVYLATPDKPAGMLDLKGLPGEDHPAVEVSWPLRCADAGNGVWECAKPSATEDEAATKTVAADADADMGIETPAAPTSTSSNGGGAAASQEDDAKPSMSRFRLVAYDEASNTSLVLAEPLTGRTHQLRLHLALLGHPICNDPNYGVEGNLAHVRAEQADPDQKVVEALEGKVIDQGDREAAARALCVACTQGLDVAFKPIQTQVQGLDLHAYSYKIHLPKRDPIACTTPLPAFAKPFLP